MFTGDQMKKAKTIRTIGLCCLALALTGQAFLLRPSNIEHFFVGMLLGISIALMIWSIVLTSRRRACAGD